MLLFVVLFQSYNLLLKNRNYDNMRRGVYGLHKAYLQISVVIVASLGVGTQAIK